MNKESVKIFDTTLRDGEHEFYRGEKYLGNMLYDMKKDIKQNTR